MEEHQPVKFEEIPEAKEQSKPWHKVLYGVVAVMALALLCIKNWDTIRHPVGEYYCRKALKIYEDPDQRDAVLCLCNKAILADEDYWKPWFLKGGLYGSCGYHYDSAYIFLKKALDLHKSDRLSQGNGVESYCTYALILCLRNEKKWLEAIELAQEAVKIYVHSENLADIEKELHCCYIEYADDLLANSNDTRTMWEASTAIWDVDRKRALNLRRKCARLGDKDAQEWFIKKGYEWD